ncbi:MAG: hypothetical protein ACKVI4_12610 [Actinomycetales bacterium]
MPDPSAVEANSEQPSRVVAVVPQTLFAGPATPPRPRDEHIIEVSRETQKLGVHAVFFELHGANHGLPRGRLSEVLGRAASAGEQLGLASATSRDAHRWLAQSDQSLIQQVASRALAEITGYYTLSAAHGLGNVTLRALLTNKVSAAVVNEMYPRAQGFMPFSDNREAWVVLGARLVKTIEAAAATVGGADISALVNAVVSLQSDPRWTALEQRRGIDFHRWRPQSIDGGVRTQNPWQDLGNGQFSISTPQDNIVPDHEALVREADEALDALAEAMDKWQEALPMAMRDLGVPIFKVGDEAWLNSKEVQRDDGRSGGSSLF